MDKYRTTKEINPRWRKYDQLTAKAHLFNYGVIYLDEYGFPIDDEYLIEEIREGRSE